MWSTFSQTLISDLRGELEDARAAGNAIVDVSRLADEMAARHGCATSAESIESLILCLADEMKLPMRISRRGGGEED